MKKKNELEKIEMKAFTSFFKDGTLDLLVGNFFLFFSLTILLSRMKLSDLLSVIVSFVPAILIYLSIKQIKSNITIPRIGIIGYSEKRKRKISILLGFPVVTIVLGTIFYFKLMDLGISNDKFLQSLLFASAFLILLSAMAYFLSVNRLCIYGALGSIAFVVGKALERTTEYKLALFLLMLMVSLIPLTVGLIMLISFIKKHPVKEMR